MFELGIDDAGRGPVVGPMVLAGCLINEKTAKEFKKLGIKDSKELTKKRREHFEKIIKEKAETFEVIIAPPKEIESKNSEGIDLNKFEALACAEIINRINKGFEKIKVLIDCPSPSIIKWQDYLKLRIKNLSNLDVICEHKADRNHISVSAASVLAKCTREKEMDKIREVYGDEIGSGYTSDSLTQKFLEKNALKFKDDGIFRRTWITWKNAKSKIIQKKLG